MIEFQALGGVQGKERDRCAFVEGVCAADQRCVVKKIGESLATLDAFGDGVDQFTEIFEAGVFLDSFALA